MSSESTGTSFPAVFAHFASLCQFLIILVDICYDDLGPVIFDATPVIVLGCHELRPYEEEYLNNKCACSYSSTDELVPHLLPLLGPPCALRQNNIAIRPINNPAITSKC